MKRIDGEIVHRGQKVDHLIQELENRLKVVEDELNEEGEGDGDDDDGDSPLDQHPGIDKGIKEEINADEGLVNIGETKQIAATFASEAQLLPARKETDTKLIADPAIT